MVNGVKLSIPSAVVTILDAATEAGTEETTILDDIDNNGTETISELTERVLAMLDVELSEDVDAAVEELRISEPTAPKPPCPWAKQTACPSRQHKNRKFMIVRESECDRT